jgi:hypothetical protein
MTNVPFPLFELVGPKCKKLNCTGTLISTMSLLTKEFYLKCSACDEKVSL